MSEAVSPITHILIDRGQYVDAAGVGIGAWRFFIDFVFEDGGRCTMSDAATHAQAMADATELSEECDVPMPIVDATCGGWLQ